MMICNVEEVSLLLLSQEAFYITYPIMEDAEFLFDGADDADTDSIDEDEA